MGDALIGHTGFVGSNLHRQHAFDAVFNSATSTQMRGQHFDRVVCAGVRAVKWLANQEPTRDRAEIAALESVLGEVHVDEFVLISTIDVYPVRQGADEGYDCHGAPNHAYGTHRLAFEDFCRGRFAHCTVVRLPALFGPGLKKNVLFDLMHDKLLGAINPHSSFQYYDLTRLWDDIGRVRAAGVTTANLFTEPLTTQRVVDELFQGKAIGHDAGPQAHYALRTRHAGLWGRDDGYIASSHDVLAAMASFVRRAEPQT